jgi:hypothetical protein
VRNMPKLERIGLFILSICVFTFYLSCERDFSSISKKPVNPPPNGADTTSHNFTWRLDTLGTNWSILLDVAIINENDIWAVGAIQPDPTGVDDIYNAVHWDGQQWELKRIPFIGPCSAVDYPPIRAIWAFSEDNILFTNGGAIAKYNGSSTFLDCGMNPLLDGAIKKIFATDPSNVYAVGGVGTIVHYDGSSWQKLQSGTTVDIQDIWGAMNPQSGEWEIMAVASFGIGVPQAKQLLRIDGTTVSTVQDSGLPLALETIWFVPGEEYFVGGGGGGAGIYHTNDITGVEGRYAPSGVLYVFYPGAWAKRHADGGGARISISLQRLHLQALYWCGITGILW